MNNWRHRWRVWFHHPDPKTGERTVEVLAQSADGAMRTARQVRMMLGMRGWNSKPSRAEDMHHAGTGEQFCPLCRSKQPGLFDGNQEGSEPCNTDLK